MAAGFAALHLLSAQADPPTLSAGVLTVGCVAATALAVSAAAALQLVLSAQHPPADATTMLTTLGSLEPEWSTVGLIAVGVTLVAALGKGARLPHTERGERP